MYVDRLHTHFSYRYNHFSNNKYQRRMDYIKPIKEQLDANMHDHCVMFMLVGTPRESPRWMNFGNHNLDTKVLRIQSTQTSRIFFEVETDYDYIEVDEFWPQFKKYRTEFLIEHYPTINPY